MCGNRGCATVQASTIRFKRLVKERLKRGESSILKEGFSFQNLAEAVRMEDVVACSVYKNMIVYLGRVIINTIWCYGPQCIVLGGEMTLIGDKLLDDLKMYVKQHTDESIFHRVEILLSNMSASEALCGIGLLTAEYVFERLEIFEQSAGE